MLRGARTVAERPPSLLDPRPISSSAVGMGIVAMLAGHLLIPLFVLASQWLLVVLGMAIPADERVRPKPLDNVIAAEFVRLGKPLDPKKLPSRKVPPIAKRTPDGVVVSKDPREPPPKPEEKKEERPKDAQEDLLNNLVDRTRDFAEDVEVEEEGDPNGIREGTATSAREGNIYLGQLKLFFQRGWTVPNVIRDPSKLKVQIGVRISAKGVVLSGEVVKSSGEPLFDQSALDRVAELAAVSAEIPVPPADQHPMFYDTTLTVNFDGSGLR